MLERRIQLFLAAQARTPDRAELVRQVVEIGRLREDVEDVAS